MNWFNILKKYTEFRHCVFPLSVAHESFKCETVSFGDVLNRLKISPQITISLEGYSGQSYIHAFTCTNIHLYIIRTRANYNSFYDCILIQL